MPITGTEPAAAADADAAAAALGGGGGDERAAGEDLSRELGTRPPSYKTMLLLRASVLNKLGKSGKAIEDLEMLAMEQQSDSTAYRMLAKTQRAHCLNQAGCDVSLTLVYVRSIFRPKIETSPSRGWSASDQPGAIVPSAHVSTQHTESTAS